jgi:hypothetical protein
VPRPPIFILPKRQNGTENVVMVLGTTSRMTMTLAGSEGTSFEDMLNCASYCDEIGVDEKSGEEAVSIQ